MRLKALLSSISRELSDFASQNAYHGFVTPRSPKPLWVKRCGYAHIWVGVHVVCVADAAGYEGLAMEGGRFVQNSGRQ